MESAQRTRPSGPWSGSRPYLGFLYVGGPCGPMPLTNWADGPWSRRKPEGGGMGTPFSISPTATMARSSIVFFLKTLLLESFNLGPSIALTVEELKTTSCVVD